MSDTQAEAQAEAQPKLEGLPLRVQQYIQLRDKIAEKNDAHKAAMKPLTDVLARLNGIILDELNATGADSVSVRGVGTAYRNPKATASIADKEAFTKFIIEHGLWDMVSWTALAPAVAEYIGDNGEPPPGVNYRVVALVGVRRDSGG